MPTNQEKEMQWIRAWSDLYELLGDRTDLPCQLPDGQIVDVETCKAWLQNSAYEGFAVQVEAATVRGKRSVIATRTRG